MPRKAKRTSRRSNRSSSRSKRTTRKSSARRTSRKSSRKPARRSARKTSRARTVRTPGTAIGPSHRNFFMETLHWAKAVTLSPSANTGSNLPYNELIKRLAVISLIPGILLSIISVFGGDFVSLFMTIPIFLLSAIISPIINAAIIHFVGKIAFRLMKQDYKRTYNASAYSAIPGFLFGWIPFVGSIIGGVWSIVVGIIALSNQQGISRMRALGVFALTFAIVVIVAVILMVTVFSQFVAPEFGAAFQ